LHEVASLYRHRDRVVVLDLGRVIADGPPDAMRADGRVRQSYLG
jgi:branched-chain amino acid transport system ATP-binding protein